MPSPAIGGSVSAMWVGRPLSDYERLALLSFVAAGFEVHLYTEPGIPGLPNGVHRRDIREVMDRAPFVNPREGSTYAIYSNLFRYRLLQQEDTTWVDTDVVLVGPSLPPGPYLFGYQGPRLIASGVLRAPRDSPLLAALVVRAAAMDPAEIPWGTMGPDLLTILVQELNLGAHAVAREVLYPIQPLEAWMLFDPAEVDTVDARLAESSTVHLWHELLRRAGPVTSLAPPAGSWLDRRFAAHGLATPALPRLDPEWVCEALGRSGPPTRQRLERVTAQRDRALERLERVRSERDRIRQRLDEVRAQRDRLQSLVNQSRTGRQGSD